MDPKHFCMTSYPHTYTTGRYVMFQEMIAAFIVTDICFGFQKS